MCAKAYNAVPGVRWPTMHGRMHMVCILQVMAAAVLRAAGFAHWKAAHGPPLHFPHLPILIWLSVLPQQLGSPSCARTEGVH